MTSSSSLSLLHGNPYLYLLLQRLYKQGAKDAHSNFTLIVDRPEIILAKINAANLSDVSENITLTFLAFYLTYKNLYLHLNDVPFLFSWSTRKPSTQRRDITSVRRTLLSWLTAGRQQRSSAWYFLWLSFVDVLSQMSCFHFFHTFSFNNPVCLQKLYKDTWDKSKATGYSLDHEYIPLLSSKKGRDIASDVSVVSLQTSLTEFCSLC